MQEDLEQHRLDSLVLCNQLLVKLEENQENAQSVFAGELYQAYDAATDKAKNKVQKIRSKIRNL